VDLPLEREERAKRDDDDKEFDTGGWECIFSGDEEVTLPAYTGMQLELVDNLQQNYLFAIILNVFRSYNFVSARLLILYFLRSL